MNDKLLKQTGDQAPARQRCNRTPIAVAIYTLCASASYADSGTEQASMEEMVVTAVKTEQPLNLVTDPKKPRQPLPANDGADYLKTIPGFSVIRKGGTDGDPVLRGMAGSRLNMVLDGESILGGCTMRMDPPTAYIFPETLDQIKVIKGPQTVQYGPGNSAGVVLFERHHERPQEPEWDLHASLLAGSAGREDGLVDATYKSPEFSLRGTVTAASSDDYKDGDGVTVHSRYQRWNGQLGGAWTPTADIRLELSTARSDGDAAYADRGMDGSSLARENYNGKYIHSNISDLIQSIEVQGYYNYVDHVMDNYTLREPSGMMAAPMAMNPDRKTTGGKVVTDLSPQETIQITLGIDAQQNRRSIRTSMDQEVVDYRDLPRKADAEFTQAGLFSELSWEVLPGQRWIAGARIDSWRVRDMREEVSLSMMSTAANPTANQQRREQLESGFLRYEKTREASATASATFYAGLGYNERFPDYWEMIAKETADSLSALEIQSEKTTQLDIGYIYRSENTSVSISAFANTIDDYLMIESGFTKAAISSGMQGMGSMDGMSGMSDTRTTTIVRNIDARSWGAELDLGYRFDENWRSELTFSSVRGANDSDSTTLAQLPPMETRLGLYYEQSDWSAGILWRSIAEQERVDIGKGNIAGQDIAPTGSADILSINGGWRPVQSVLLTAGIDNLLDETYSEHISRAGAVIPGFDQLAKVNEPGRTLWMKAVYNF